jgi:preprotein translocase subunit SecG
MLTLAMNPYVVSGLVALFLLICVVLILTVLIQRPQGGGLSGAFGAGGGSGQTAFGTRTGDALTIATIGMFILYLVVAVGLNFATRPTQAVAPAAVPMSGGSTTVETTPDAPAPAEPATSEPIPTEPIPTEPAPMEPASTAPAPTEPASTGPVSETP